MAKYRKKPVVIDAIQMTEEMRLKKTPLPAGIKGSRRLGDLGKMETEVPYFTERKPFFVETLEGKMSGWVGDYLITGVKGELYFCRKDIFEETYESV